MNNRFALPQISFNEVTIAIGSKIICQKLSLNMQAGQVWGVLGANGCGKSTFLHAIARLQPCVAGEIRVMPLQSSIAKNVGLLFQESQQIFSQSVYDYCAAARFPHLSLFKKFSRQDEQLVDHALDLLSLTSLRHTSILKLSGGEKRRTAIASLLIQQPAIYLLDEPANHLDLHYQVKIFKHLRYLASHEQAIIVMALHDINHAQLYCDQLILLFNDGTLMHGSKDIMLTAANLTKLYQYPIEAISWQKEIFWKAATGV